MQQMITCPPVDSVTGMDGAMQLFDTDHVSCVTYRVSILYHPPATLLSPWT